MALPTANKKEGKTRSVGVNPCHAACCNGEKVVAPLPDVLTMIIKQIVMPLKTSRAGNRWEAAMLLVCIAECNQFITSRCMALRLCFHTGIDNIINADHNICLTWRNKNFFL
jgi:hypothetical protein